MASSSGLFISTFDMVMATVRSGLAIVTEKAAWMLSRGPVVAKVARLLGLSAYCV